MAKSFFFKARFLPQRFGDIRHKPLEPVRVLQLPAKRIRRLVRALWHHQDRVAPALDQLLNELVTRQNPFHIILPAMEVDDEINLARLPEAFGNEDRHRAV